MDMEQLVKPQTKVYTKNSFEKLKEGRTLGVERFELRMSLL